VEEGEKEGESERARRKASVENGAGTGSYSRGVHASEMTDVGKRVNYTNPLLFAPLLLT
jgi:hypothetical protein